MMNLVLGLDAWIVQDGNYSDFEVGQHIEVAVEFRFEECSPGPPAASSCTWVSGCEHDVVGTVTFVTPEFWVLDVGIQIYCDQPIPSGVAPGSVLRGRASLGVDHFAYFERYALDANAPPLIYSWRVTAIHRATRDGWVEVERTDAWNDDDGHASYAMSCELQPAPPRRKSATAVHV